MSSLVVKESSGSDDSGDEVEIPSPPPIIRDNDDATPFTKTDTLDGWNEAQDPNKPSLEPKNTDDRTSRVIKVFGKDISVLEVLEELGYKEGDKLPEGDMTTPVEDPNEDFKIDYYPTGLVTSVVDSIEDMPDTVADNLSDDSSKGEIIYHIVGWLNYHGKAKDGKTIPQQQIEAIKSKYSGGRKKRRRKTKRRKSRRKRKTKKRKRTRKKRKKRRKKKTRR